MNVTRLTTFLLCYAKFGSLKMCRFGSLRPDSRIDATDGHTQFLPLVRLPSASIS